MIAVTFLADANLVDFDGHQGDCMLSLLTEQLGLRIEMVSSRLVCNNIS